MDDPILEKRLKNMFESRAGELPDESVRKARIRRNVYEKIEREGNYMKKGFMKKAVAAVAVICVFGSMTAFAIGKIAGITSRTDIRDEVHTYEQALEAIDKVRDTSTSHERCSIIEVMGRHAGYIALWCGIANGAEDILLPERYDGNEQMLINRIIDNRKRGKRHHIIINAEGIGHSASMAKRIEAATGIETRATILGYMQRGGAPTCKDRVYASIMGAKAVELLEKGKTNRVVAYKHGEFLDFDIQEALNMKKDIPEDQYEISKLLIR